MFQLKHRHVLPTPKGILPQEPILDKEHGTLMDNTSRSLPLQLEDDHPVIMSGCKQVESGVSGDAPVPVLPSEGVDAVPLVEVPQPGGVGDVIVRW